MHQSGSKQRFGTLTRSIGWIQIIGVVTLLTLISCSPKENNASAPNQTDGNSTQVQSQAGETTNSPGSTPGTADSPADMTVDPNSTNILDNALVIKGAQDNLFEIQAGQLATQKATSTEVKQFAQRIGIFLSIHIGMDGERLWMFIEIPIC